MKPQKTYRVWSSRNLFLLRAAVGAPRLRPFLLRLLVDTGSSYTLLPVEVLEAVGCDTHYPVSRVRIITANGILLAPRVRAPQFSCLGQKLENFPVVAHTLPAGAMVDGLLGMDFLHRCHATISVPQSTITCRQS